MSTNVVDKAMKAVWNDKTGLLEIDDVPVQGKSQETQTMYRAIYKCFDMGWSNEKTIKTIGWPDIVIRERGKWNKSRRK